MLWEGALPKRKKKSGDGCAEWGCTLLILMIPIGFAIQYARWIIPLLLLLGILAYLGTVLEKRKTLAKAEAERASFQRQLEATRAAETERARQAEEKRLHRIATTSQSADTARQLSFMSGTEFEDFVSAFLQHEGYEVRQTGGTGGQGVDMLIRSDNRTIALQLKRYSAPVGNKAVQEAFSGMFHHGADEAWVITTSSFTPSAKSLARSTGVKLVDGQELIRWLRDAQADILAPRNVGKDHTTISGAMPYESNEPFETV